MPNAFQWFYVSGAWIKCRDAYAAKAGGLCERCLSRGIIKPGAIVHHVQPITARNINDPAITLNDKNLMLLCRECHGEIHRGEKRYKVDKITGKVTPK